MSLSPCLKVFIVSEDVRSFEARQLFADGALVVADNVLKPGAPKFLWRLSNCDSFDVKVLQVTQIDRMSSVL
eukprot:620329-Amphidinium_carterae.1